MDPQVTWDELLRAFACQDWAATKAAYRFLSNARVDEEKILAGHFLCTRERFAATDSPVLVLHDTTEFSYHRDDPEAVGILQRLAMGYTRGGQPGHLHVVSRRQRGGAGGLGRDRLQRRLRYCPTSGPI